MAEELKTVNKYDKTPWKDGSTPALNAENLNKIEQGISDVTEATNKSIGAVNKLNENYQAADTRINNRIDSLTLSNINDQTADIIILDGGNGKPTTEQET